MNLKNILKFNTGRSYTAHGQRIAAIAVDGGVFMNDQDRGLDYFFPDCNLSQNEIMRRYDNNDRGQYSSPSINKFGKWHLIMFMELDHSLPETPRTIEQFIEAAAMAEAMQVP